MKEILDVTAAAPGVVATDVFVETSEDGCALGRALIRSTGSTFGLYSVPVKA